MLRALIRNKHALKTCGANIKFAAPSHVQLQHRGMMSAADVPKIRDDFKSYKDGLDPVQLKKSRKLRFWGFTSLTDEDFVKLAGIELALTTTDGVEKDVDGV